MDPNPGSFDPCHFLPQKWIKLHIVWTNVFGALNPWPKRIQILDHLIWSALNLLRASLFDPKIDQTLHRLDQCFRGPESEAKKDSSFGSSDALFGIWSNFLEKRANFDPICAERNFRHVKYHFLKINTKKNSDSFSWEIRRSLKDTLKIRQTIACAAPSACEPAPLPFPKEKNPVRKKRQPNQISLPQNKYQKKFRLVFLRGTSEAEGYIGEWSGNRLRRPCLWSCPTAFPKERFPEKGF
jgi:hypothetical protein